MREIRQSGSEGGGADQAALPTPIQQTVKLYLSGSYGTRSKKYAALGVSPAEPKHNRIVA